MKRDDPNHPILLQPAIIRGLPATLARVPDERAEWEAWRDDVTLYREYIRKRAATDREVQAQELYLCAQDFCYWMVMYGIIFEPRALQGMPPRWLRWIPYHFQVQAARWIELVMSTTDNGRGDGVIEKSRDMGASWLFCAYMAWCWLFADVFVAGVISKKAEDVDKPGATGTLFYKIRALVGLEPQVPPSLAPPAWMLPVIPEREKVTRTRNLSHPAKTCAINGETTTALSGVSDRNTMRLNDEAARFDSFVDSWANQGATTEHRFAVSTADTVNLGFYELAKLARECSTNPYKAGPSYLALPWWLHPYHDDAWYANEQKRYEHDPQFFSREYDMQYFAGAGDAIYPRIAEAAVGHFPYTPGLGELWCAIDPGVKDPTAIAWIQKDDRENRWRVVRAYETPGGTGPEHVASLLTGTPISGPEAPHYTPEEIDLMAWTASLGRVRYVGDHYGTHKATDGKTSFYSLLAEKSRALTEGRHVVTVATVTKDNAREFSTRRTALAALLPRIDWHDHPSVAVALSRMKEARFQNRNPNRQYAKEITAPAHDYTSHTRTMFEYFAVNVSARLATTRNPRRQGSRGRRITMSGRLLPA